MLTRLAAVAFGVPLFLALSSCGGVDGPRDDGEAVSGFVVDVQAKSLLELSSLTLRDEAGVTWKFEASGAGLGEFTPSHLRQHGILSEPVTVAFHRRDGVLVIDGITD